MSLLPYAAAAWLFVVGLYGAATSRHLAHLVVCLTVMQSSTYVILAAVGYARGGAAPVLAGAPAGAPLVDPVVQALMLTDIVVEAAVVALLLALALQLQLASGGLDPDQAAELRG